MKVGLYLATQFTPETYVSTALAQIVEQVRRARASGFSSLWVPHHYLTQPMQMLAPIPMLAYLAPAAEGMTLGANILIMPLLNPVHVAEDAVTLDLLSGGNYVVGLGVGYREAEFNTFNVPLKERVQRLTESIEIMRRLWTEERVTYKGKIFEVADLGLGLKPMRPSGPPVWIAGVVDAAVKRAARIGDALQGSACCCRQAVSGGRADHSRVLCWPLTGEGAGGMQGGVGIQISRLFLLGTRQTVGGCRILRPAL
jgi:alkanesulfonate monooxygenase SsuD/methylene tetrahydromethanopterin reductase-like flavin-dependent oxidoreductase (luciferase family)